MVLLNILFSQLELKAFRLGWTAIDVEKRYPLMYCVAVTGSSAPGYK